MTFTTGIKVLHVNLNTVGNGAGAPDNRSKLMEYIIPANTLGSNRETLRIKAWGTTANNQNNKNVALWFGDMYTGTFIGGTGSGPLNQTAWVIDAVIGRRSSTVQNFSAVCSAFPFVPPYAGTCSEITSGPLSIACYGVGPMGGDVVQQGMIVELLG